MRFSNKIRDGLNVAFNESKINYLDISDESIEVVLDCLCMNENNEFPDDSRIKILFKPYGKIIISIREGGWNNESAEIIKFDRDKLKDYFQNLMLDSMYGWEFINLDESKYKHWADKLSFCIETGLDYSELNTIDLFAEQLGKESITIDLRIWFEDLKIFDWTGNEMTTQQFIDRGQRGWNQLYKTGIHTQDHKNTRMKD
jgi:hypothetical protein